MPAAGPDTLSRPPPLSQYVLKVHSRCDLACDHCYIYEHADQSWRRRPYVMAPATVRAAAARIAEHSVAHGLAHVHVILHGGEPLLMGIHRLCSTLAELRERIDPVARLHLRMQSNGVLLSPAICDLLREYEVSVGISLDGGAEANDRHRRFANGASSHAHVLRALALLRRPEYRGIYGGILCTVDLDNDPERVYEALVAELPPRIDFLLPHATWDDPPRRPPGDATPYATWLRRIHERWSADGRPVPIRLFDSLRSVAAGGPSGTEAIGLDAADLVVIESDGAWEQADSLKTAYDGAPATGLDVFSHAVDEAAAHPGVAARQGGLSTLCHTCRACTVVHQCGGGLFAHRYRTGSGFDNPSVYCADLKELILATSEQPTARQSTRSEHLAPGQSGPERPEKPTDAIDPLPPAVLDEIGSGYGSATTLEHLAASQLAITRGLVVAVGHALAAERGSIAVRWAQDGWDLLRRLDSDAPQAVHAVLSHPYVRAWAVRCLSRASSESPADDMAHLACLAAAAAIRAGVTAAVTVPVRDGIISLPTLGRFVLDAQATASGAVSAAVSTMADRFAVRVGRTTETVVLGDNATQPEGWQPVRRVEREGLAIAIEDTDPYRDCHGWPVADRLAPPQVRDWESSIVDAWVQLGMQVPAYLPGLRTGLRVITPLRADSTGRLRSAARHAFGAVGTAAAARDGALAVLLVHEFQHVKLGAVLDVCDLVDPAYRQVLTVPWRTDPRPGDAVLQETYAHLAAAAVWRARAALPGSHRLAAVEHYRRYRTWTAGAIDSLRRTRALTPTGERFVDRMSQTVEGWSGHPR
jgi:uncharacterized protein